MTEHSYLESPNMRRLSRELRLQISAAQRSADWIRSATAADLFMLARDSLGLRADLPCPFGADQSAIELGDLPHSRIVSTLTDSFPPGTTLADELADQIQLQRAFESPDRVAQDLANIVRETVLRFPRDDSDIRVGSNPGDVLDPFILAANFSLLSGRDFTKTIELTVSHKALMKIEDLLGNMHQEVVSSMRGNFRVPEPRRGRKAEKETLDPITNPFPGADVGQVPLPSDPNRIRLFQIKSKTGSAKGGDGKRLGLQLHALEEIYGARTFYAAIVGNTLRGHRSKCAVIRESPETAVLVGAASLRELSGSQSGAELLLRVYQRAFRLVARELGYDLERVTNEITATFRAQAEAEGDDFLDALLHQAVNGSAREQDTRATGETLFT